MESEEYMNCDNEEMILTVISLLPSVQGMVHGASRFDDSLVDYPRIEPEKHNRQGGGLKDMSSLCLTTSQRHELMKGLTPRPGDRYHMADDILATSSKSSIRPQPVCTSDSRHHISKMPRTPTKSTVKVESQPYPSFSPPSNDSDSKDDGSLKKGKVDKKGSKGSAWTGEEQLQLFQFAMNRNGRSWGDAVPGKSGVQACSLWT